MRKVCCFRPLLLRGRVRPNLLLSECRVDVRRGVLFGYFKVDIEAALDKHELNTVTIVTILVSSHKG